MHQVAGGCGDRLLFHMGPQALQVEHVGMQRFQRRTHCRSAHDVTAAFAMFARQGGDEFAQARALGFFFDARRHADLGAAWHVDQEARRQRDVRGQPRALGAERVLDHLHEQVIALAHQRADVGFGFGCGHQVRIARRQRRREDISHVQETGAGQPDVEKGRLHARQHARHPALVEVADQALATGPLDEDFLQHTVVDECSTGLARRDVHQDLDGHVALPMPMPASPSSCAVSNRGSPMTPEKLPVSPSMKTAARPWMA